MKTLFFMLLALGAVQGRYTIDGELAQLRSMAVVLSEVVSKKGDPLPKSNAELYSLYVKHGYDVIFEQTVGVLGLGEGKYGFLDKGIRMGWDDGGDVTLWGISREMRKQEYAAETDEDPAIVKDVYYVLIERDGRFDALGMRPEALEEYLGRAESSLESVWSAARFWSDSAQANLPGAVENDSSQGNQPQNRGDASFLADRDDDLDSNLEWWVLAVLICAIGVASCFIARKK